MAFKGSWVGLKLTLKVKVQYKSVVWREQVDGRYVSGFSWWWEEETIYGGFWLIIVGPSPAPIEYLDLIQLFITDFHLDGDRIQDKRSTKDTAHMLWPYTTHPQISIGNRLWRHRLHGWKPNNTFIALSAARRNSGKTISLSGPLHRWLVYLVTRPPC